MDFSNCFFFIFGIRFYLQFNCVLDRYCGLEEILIIYFRHSQTDLPQKKKRFESFFSTIAAEKNAHRPTPRNPKSV